jgi:hypothetical protein
LPIQSGDAPTLEAKEGAMASLADTVIQAGSRLGLKSVPDKKLAYGVRDGYLVEVACGRNGGGDAIVQIIRHGDPARDAAVREAIGRSADVAAKGIKPKRVDVEDGLVIHRHPVMVFQRPAAEAVAGEVDALLRAVQTASAPTPARCRLCGSDSGAEPVLLNDVVDRVCLACAERLGHETRQAIERYDATPTNLPLAALAAAGLAVLAAVGWAGVAIATNRVFWLVAIGAGLAIGWGTTRAAGKGGRLIQGVAALFTVASVLLGELLLVAYHVQQQAQRAGQRVDWTAFATSSPTILWQLGGETLFALGGGLIGAWYATRWAGRPKIEARVEKA